MAKKATNGITHETIIRDIQAGNIAPVYYLMGEEPYYIERLAAFISESVVKPEERDFNLTTVYGTDVSMTDIVQAALSFPTYSVSMLSACGSISALFRFT